MQRKKSTEIGLSANSTKVPINLPEFKGYDSFLDIYTFRAGFETLIEPVVQRKLWSDYLKRNYLTGPALLLVDRIET